MTDTAVLGISVDSSGVKAATGDLKELSAASRSAEQASVGLANAGAKSETQLRAIEKAANRAGITTAEFEARTAAFSAATEKAAQAQTKLSAATVAGGAASSVGAAGLVRSLASYNGISLALQAVTAASAAYFSLTQTSAPELEQSLEENARLVGLVKNAWRDAKGEVAKYHESTQAIVELQLQLNLADLQSKIRSQIGDAMKSLAPQTFNTMPAGDVFGVSEFDTSGLGKFASAVDTFYKSLGTGAPALEAFRAEIAKIGLENPALAETAGSMLKLVESASKTTDRYRWGQKAARINTGKGSEEDKADFFGRPRSAGAAADPFAASVASADRHIAAMTADAQAVGTPSTAMARLRDAARRDACAANDNAADRQAGAAA